MSERERFHQIDEVFRAARNAPAAERAALLDGQCLGDPGLRAEVEALLAEDQVTAGFLDGVDAPAPAPPLPDRIGPYRIIRRLGAGGMGVVYEAEQEEPRRRVALKVIHAGWVTGDLLRRFRHEAHVLAQLKHPGIAAIYESGMHVDGQPFFAMELVNGPALLEYATRHELDTRARLELIARVAEAAHHAHQKGVIHRDLKPGNILVEEGQPKILDFGVARATDADLHAVTIRTDIGQLVGTVPYMSPEQASGDRDAIDIRSDVYALGVIAYELLTGRLPYDVHDTPLPEAVRRIREVEPARLSSFARWLRGDVETIVRKALEKEKERRYPSAAELAADIRRYLKDEPIQARPTSALYQLRKFSRRNRGLVAALAVAFVAMVAGTGFSIWKAVAAGRAEQVANSRSYLALIVGATAAAQSGDATTARRLLDTADERHRDRWEWRYLDAQLDTSLRMIRLDGSCVGFRLSADGRRAFVVLSSGLVQSWDVATGEVLSADRLDVDRLQVAALTADGAQVAGVTASNPGVLGIWETVGGRLATRLAELSAADSAAIDISADGRRLAAGMWLWTIGEPSTGDPIFPSGRFPKFLVFADDGGQLGASLALAGQAQFVVLDVPTRRQLHSWGTNRGLSGGAISGDGSRWAVGGQDKKVRVWDAATTALRFEQEGHVAVVQRVALDRSGEWLASGDASGAIALWDVEAGRRAAMLAGHTEGILGLAFDPGGTRLVSVSSDRTIRVWDTMRDDADVVLRGHGSYVYDVSFAPDGARIFSGSWDGTVRAWDAATGACVATWEGNFGYVTQVETSPDGRLVAGGDYERRKSQAEVVRLWDASTGALVHAFPRHHGELTALAFSPDGSRLAAATRYSPFRIWDMATYEPAARTPDAGTVSTVRWSPDGRQLATTGYDGLVRLWDAGSGGQRAVLGGHAQRVRGAAFSPDGRLLATASDDGTARLWAVTDGSCRAVLRPAAGQVFAVAFSPEGTRLATGCEDGSVRIWDVATADELLSLRGHADYVYGLAFSPDGTILASCSGDGTVRLWHTRPRRARGAPGLRAGSPLVE